MLIRNISFEWLETDILQFGRQNEIEFRRVGQEQAYRRSTEKKSGYPKQR